MLAGACEWAPDSCGRRWWQRWLKFRRARSKISKTDFLAAKSLSPALAEKEDWDFFYLTSHSSSHHSHAEKLQLNSHHPLSPRCSSSHLPYPKYPWLYFYCALSSLPSLCPPTAFRSSTLLLSLSEEGCSCTVLGRAQLDCHTHLGEVLARRGSLSVHEFSGFMCSWGWPLCWTLKTCSQLMFCQISHTHTHTLTYCLSTALTVAFFLLQLCTSFQRTCSHTKKEQRELWPCMSCV